MATSPLINRLIPTVAPRLPSSPQPPDALFINQLNNVLRLYFNQIDSLAGNLAGGQGGRFLNIPYGAFSSYVDQTAVANTATKLLMEVTDFSNGVTAPSSRLTVANAGIYNLQFSVQAQNLQNSPQDMFIWLKQNGTDIPGSTGLIGLPARKDAIDPAHDIKGWNYFVSMNANDYIEIYWSIEDVLVTIQHYAASGSPTKPSTASVVATMSFVSTLPA